MMVECAFVRGLIRRHLFRAMVESLYSALHLECSKNDGRWKQPLRPADELKAGPNSYSSELDVEDGVEMYKSPSGKKSVGLPGR